jgi:hypothetical protein
MSAPSTDDLFVMLFEVGPASDASFGQGIAQFANNLGHDDQILSLQKIEALHPPVIKQMREILLAAKNGSNVPIAADTSALVSWTFYLTLTARRRSRPSEH